MAKFSGNNDLTAHAAKRILVITQIEIHLFNCVLVASILPPVEAKSMEDPRRSAQLGGKPHTEWRKALIGGIGPARADSSKKYYNSVC